MTDQHPITPPPELVQQWADMIATHTDTEVFSAAAQWGADQELEACCEWVAEESMAAATELRAARRLKPSLKEQALTALTRYMTGEIIFTNDALDTIRHALEQLP